MDIKYLSPLAFAPCKDLFLRLMLILSVACLPLFQASAQDTNQHKTQDSIQASQLKGADIIEKMNQAKQKNSYRGNMVIYNEMKKSEYRLVNLSDGEKSHYYSIESLTGDNNKLVIKDNTVYCYFPNKKVVVKDTVMESVDDNKTSNYSRAVGDYSIDDALLNLSIIEQYYDIKLNESLDEKEAGRHVYVIELMPKDEFRYRQEIRVDRENYLMLSFKIINHKEKVVRSQFFTSIHFSKAHEIEVEEKIDISDWSVVDFQVEKSKQKAVPNPAVKQEGQSDKYNEAKELTGIVFEQHATLESNPESKKDDMAISLINNRCMMPVNIHGFKYQSSMARLKSANEKMQQYNFSDGISTVSVFVDSMATKETLDSLRNAGFYSKKDSIISYSQAIEENKLVVMGEVPMALIEAFVNHLDCH